ncbi:MAG: efflux RND transporter periplasmic adaptor subunit [Lysobacterales bacterium]
MNDKEFHGMKPQRHRQARTYWTRLLLGSIAAGLVACGNSDGPGPQQRVQAAVGVTTQTARLEPWVDRIEALGTARANESLMLSAKVTETVARVNFDDGQQVSEGAVLVELTDRAEVAALKEAQASFAEADKQTKRLEDLVEQGTVPRSSVDQQVALRDQARARMDAIRARLSDRVITAPFAGQLGFRMVSPGALVTPGTPIATLDDISTIKLDFPVPERFFAELQPGRDISARTAAYPEQTFQGTVRSIDSRVDPATRSVTVRAELANDQRLLRPGMLMVVELITPAREVVVIDEISLVQIGSEAFVYRVGSEAKAERVVVQPGRRSGGRLEIVQGLQPGDRIVSEGVVKLRPGMTLTLLDAGGGSDGGSVPGTAD